MHDNKQTLFVAVAALSGTAEFSDWLKMFVADPSIEGLGFI